MSQDPERALKTHLLTTGAKGGGCCLVTVGLVMLIGALLFLILFIASRH